MTRTFAQPANYSWIDLDSLLRDFHLGLVVIAGSDAQTGSRPVQWVHSSDLLDPTPFLTPRTVLLTTGEQFKSTLRKNTADAYVSRLVAAGATALGVAVGLRWDRIPPTLVEACERLELPLVRVPYDTPFIAITRTAARLIDAAAHARTLDALEAARDPHPSRVARSEAALRTAIVQLILGDERDLATTIAAPLFPRLPRGQVAVISLVDARGLELNSLGDGAVFGELDGRTLLICESAKVPQARKLLSGRAAGLSERGSLQELEALVDQADRALEHSAATAVKADATPALVAYRPAMHSGVLQFLDESPEARRRASGFLAPIRTHDHRNQDDVEASLETWLRHNGQLSPAAEELGIHRHTLRSRIRLASSLLQRDLDSPDTRAELWTALRITAAHSRR